MAGFNIALAVDNDESAVQTYNALVGEHAFVGDLSGPIDKLEQTTASIDSDRMIIIGGPPCTAFSHAGFWLQHKRDGEDAQADRIDDFIDSVRSMRPKAFLMENVPGLLFRNHRWRLDAAIGRLKDDGYCVTEPTILNAADFGVPQTRRRMFLVGVRGDSNGFEFPAPPPFQQRRTAGQAFSGLDTRSNPEETGENAFGKYQDLIEKIPPGDNYSFFTAHRGHATPQFRWRSKYWSFLRKLDKDEPASTIPATRVTYNGPFHWESRRLRMRELARLQAFPDSLPIGEPVRFQRHVGNAVPPLLATYLFVSLGRALEAEVQNRAERLLAVAADPTVSYPDVLERLQEACALDEEAGAKEPDQSRL